MNSMIDMPEAPLVDLYRNNRNRYITKISYRVGNKYNAEDVVQEAFTRALKYLPTYDDKQPIDKWFSTILNNACRDFQREERRQGAVDKNYETEELDITMFKDEVVARILEEIHSNDKRNEKDVLNSFLVYGYTAKEVCELTGESLANVRKIVLRFREKMRDVHGEDMYR